jgi:hypothetical protein
MSITIKNNSQINSGQRPQIQADPSRKAASSTENPAQLQEAKDSSTEQAVRIGVSAAPTTEQSAQAQGGVLQAHINAQTANKPRSRGRRTGALREPNAVQLLRSMKNPEAMKPVLAMQNALARVFAD